jgi:hypothetical protein
MPQLMKQHRLEKDRQIMEENHLGSLLMVSQSVRLVPLLLRRASYALLLLGIIVVIFVFANILVRVPNVFPGEYALFALYMSMSGACFLIGLSILRVEKPNVPQKKRLVVCEHGFFQMTQERRHNDVVVVHWSDILTIRNPSFEGIAYTFVLREREPFLLDLSYQRVEHVVALIQDRMESV